MSNANFIIAPSNLSIFTNSLLNDTILYTNSSNLRLGNTINAVAPLNITSNAVYTSNVNFGINNSNPQAALDIIGNTKMTGTITTGNACSLRYWTITGTTPSALGTTSSAYALPTGLTPSAIVGLWGVFSWTPNSYMAINNSYSTFTPDGNANAYQVSMYIDSTGFHICTSPSATLSLSKPFTVTIVTSV